MEPVTLAFEVENDRLLEEAIQNGGCSWDICNELAPFFDGTVGGHEGGTFLMSAHDDLEEELSRFGRKDFKSHVIDEQEVWLEIASQDSVMAHVFIFEEISDDIEDGAVEDEFSLMDGL